MCRFLLMTVCLVLTACGDSRPVKIGFIGSLTGHTVDLGSRSRNAAILAVEQWNANGGIHGRRIELVIKDDKYQTALAKAAATDLIAADVIGIIGPSNSTMALEIVPLTNAAQLPLLGTTVTTDQLNDQDDYFFRPAASTRTSTRHLRDFITQDTDIKRYAIISDLSNAAFTDSWRQQFKQWMTQSGIETNFQRDYQHEDNLTLLGISQQLTLIETDLVVLVMNARDAALLVKQIRSYDAKIPIATSEWSGTREFLRLAGSDGDGVIVPRYIDEDSSIEAFTALMATYQSRFQQDMGYAGLLSYAATNALLEAATKKADNQTIKDYLITTKTFDGVLTDFEFNTFGDETTNAFHFITEVNASHYSTVRQ